MNALAIALQGVGYPALVTALQGLVEFGDEVLAGSGGSSGGYPPTTRQAPASYRPNRRPAGVETSPSTEETAASAGEMAGTRQVPASNPPVTRQPQGSAAQMLRAELAQIETRARERQAQFAALQAQMSALGAAERAELLAARKRDNNRRAQILIALLMLN
jgi:hypothetical protein